MIKLRLRFRVVSPLFLGGATPERAEIRAASIKGALRWWYRAVDPQFGSADDWAGASRSKSENGKGEGTASREELIFGGTQGRAGQSCFFIQVEDGNLACENWSGLFDGKQPPTGVSYLGFPFRPTRKGDRGERRCVKPGQEVDIRCIVLRSPEQAVHRRAILASWWLLGTFGALGSRARRGFGSLALADWRLEDSVREKGERVADEWERDLVELQPALADSTREWRLRVDNGLKRIEEWFGSWKSANPGSEKAKHPHLGRHFRYRLLENGYDGRLAWQDALNDVGYRLQGFRAGESSDNRAARNWLAGKGELQRTPNRATFGLPLKFGFRVSKGAGPSSVTFVPSGVLQEREDFHRHASLLLIKLVPVGNAIHPLCVRMDGAVPGVEPPATTQQGSRKQPLRPAERNLMDEFLERL